MKTGKIFLVVTVVAGLMLAACAPGSASVTLNNSGWSLKTLNGQAVLSDTMVTANFADGKLNGSDGCNRFSGSYTESGNKITINKDLVSTMMACPEPVMTQATAYLAALAQASTFKNDGKELTLFDAGGKTLATFAVVSSELGGTSWKVTAYNNGNQAVVSLVAGTELTADFSTDGKVSGSSGCNNFTATYETSGKTIKIGQAASTLMMCTDPAGVMEQEAQYLAALQSAATYRVDGNTLEMRTADDALAAMFVSVAK
jgi:heat shock protein HslJ